MCAYAAQDVLHLVPLHTALHAQLTPAQHSDVQRRTVAFLSVRDATFAATGLRSLLGCCGQQVPAHVVHVSRWGAFVMLAPGVTSLVHRSAAAGL